MKLFETIFVVAVLVFGFSFAQGVAGVTNAVGELCNGVKGVLPIVAMLMVVLAGVVYASGQLMGSETRARANVWATACLTGALISVLIVVVAPSVLGMIYTDAAGSCQGCAKVGGNACGGQNGCCTNGFSCADENAQPAAAGTCQCIAEGAQVVGNRCEVPGQEPQCVVDADCNNANLVCVGGQCVQRQQQCEAPNLQCGANCVAPADQCNGGCPCAGATPVCGANGCRAAGNGEYGDACGVAGDDDCGPNNELYSCNNGIDGYVCGGNGQDGAVCGGVNDIACNCVGGRCAAACVQLGGACQNAGQCCQGQARAVVCNIASTCALCMQQNNEICPTNDVGNNNVVCCAGLVCRNAGLGIPTRNCLAPGANQPCDPIDGNADCPAGRTCTRVAQYYLCR